MPDVVIALDIGGTKLAAAAVDANSSVLHRRQVRTPAMAGAEAVMAAAIDLARRLRETCPDAAGVGVGSAGQIDVETGRVIYANEILPGWTGMDIRGRIEGALSLPAAVDNDANTMALAEARVGAAAGYRVVLLVAVGTGIGGGLVFDGHLFRGASSVAGSVGHVPLDGNGPLCACGRRGCLEAYAAGPRIAADYAAVVGLDGPLELLEVLSRARTGDADARLAFARAGRRIGTALAGLVNVLNPDAVVLGGGVLTAGDLLLGPLKETLTVSALPANRAAVTILPAALSTDAGLVGAALLARDMFRVGSDKADGTARNERSVSGAAKQAEA